MYPDRAYCFVCRYSCPSDNIVSAEELQQMRQEPADIEEEMAYIQQLPIRDIRGLKLPVDDQGYYIVWPNNNFYKKRLFEGKSRYVGPRGHRPPIFEYLTNRKSCIVIEGELNAVSGYNSLSSKVTNRVTILSPGSATELPKILPYLLTFDTIAIIVDRDIPGVGWGSNLKHELVKHQKKVQLVAVEKDINQILQEEGKEGVKKWFKENVDMPPGVQID